MTEFQNSLALSSSAMHAQASRIRHISENIANADTPGYRRKSMSFDLQDGLVTPGKTRLDQSALTQVFDPSHPLADDTGHYAGSNVDLMLEVADAQEAQRSYQANLKMFDQTRRMSSDLLGLLRK